MPLQLLPAWHDSAWPALLTTAVTALALALMFTWVGEQVLMRVSGRLPIGGEVVRHIRRPMWFMVPLLVLHGVWNFGDEDLLLIRTVRQTNLVLLLACATWGAMRAIRGVAEGVLSRYPVDVVANLGARRIHTQLRMLSRVAQWTTFLVGLALILVSFPAARQVGTSLLASAGVAGLAAGIAARPVIGNLIAGLQIAFAQPIRLDDVLIVQGEWGRVEEITSSYVVMKLWDERRLIVPLQWMIENPFQNWTRNRADILGSVFVWVDYRMPLEPVHEAARKACEASPLWDGRVCVVQTVDATDRAVQIRILVSSGDSARNFDLRVAVREALIRMMQRDYPDCLPRVRAEIDGPSSQEYLSRSPKGMAPGPWGGPADGR
jgi:small-conductance mechanosensitive channel